MPSLKNVLGSSALFLLGATAAQAHDALQSSTDIQLRPDAMEVDLTMARSASRTLADNPPDVPVTEDSFAGAYKPLFQKSAPSLLSITLDGKKLEPRSTSVALYDEADIQFIYIFDRPPNGEMVVVAPFIKKMEDGYANSLGMNEGKNVLGFGNENADEPTWSIVIGAPPIKPPSEANPPPLSVPATSTAAPPATTIPSSTAAAVKLAHAVIVVAANGMVALLLFALFLRHAKKTKR